MPFQRFGIRFEEPGTAPPPRDVIAAFLGMPGLYLHIPFCRTICPYCPYNKVRYRQALATDYMQALERETAMYLTEEPGPFPSLYVGGGTPTLCLDELEPLVESMPITGERAIEVLPIHMTTNMSRRLTDAGFDYVSLGVQSFDDSVLRRLRRPGTPASNRAAIEAALGVFSCVNIDLIFDTGFDEPQTLLDDLATCFGYGVDQVSTYPLMRFGFTPFGKGTHFRDREHGLLHEATELAGAHGYERRSVWTFNRVGSPTYSSITRPYYLGLGAGAASFIGELFLVNHFGLDAYRRDIDADRLPIARIARLPRPAAAAYRTFWQAYTGAVPLHTADPLLGHPASVALRNLSRALRWSRRVDDVVGLTDSGYDRYHDLERWITYQLIEPLWAEMMQEHQPIATRVPEPRARAS